MSTRNVCSENLIRAVTINSPHPQLSIIHTSIADGIDISNSLDKIEPTVAMSTANPRPTNIDCRQPRTAQKGQRDDLNEWSCSQTSTDSDKEGSDSDLDLEYTGPLRSVKSCTAISPLVPKNSGVYIPNEKET